MKPKKVFVFGEDVLIDRYETDDIDELISIIEKHETRTIFVVPADKRLGLLTWERPVLCVETGEVFRNIQRCASHFGLTHKQVWGAIRFGTPRKGYHFKDYKGDEYEQGKS